jgi:hypothetical protein
VAALEYRQQQIAAPDVGDDQCFVAPLGIQLTGFQARQVVGVMRAAGQRVLKNRWIRGHARHAVLGDQSGQRAVADQAARQVVEPEALAEGGDALRGIHGQSFLSCQIQGSSHG